MRRIMIAGNWKMHKLAGEAQALASDLKTRFSGTGSNVAVVLCPPFTALAAVATVIADTKILLGAQNMHWEGKGAYTGEVSPLMLKDAGCTHVIIGHSERRQLFGETDETVDRKVHAALAAGLKPIVCVGETESQRDGGRTEAVVIGQVRSGLADLTAQRMSDVTIAYEPVWAIGTGKNATPQQAQEVHALIRGLIAEIFSAPVASSLLILYGGSVKPDNARELLAEPDIDGALVGGASLDADSFDKIVRAGIAVAPHKKS
ncbi:MAG: triose-phosphate isomerase [Candidatus Lindowbacteria bacterium]|nr:triose-phosphate isomerase [Candidatus Lindowbacteria bacterium]